jgi:hypothetical protein
MTLAALCYSVSLLDTMFLGDASMRNKYNLILCQTMDPLLPADDYMDKSDNENELKQVCGADSSGTH